MKTQKPYNEEGGEMRNISNEEWDRAKAFGRESGKLLRNRDTAKGIDPTIYTLKNHGFGLDSGVDLYAEGFREGYLSI